MADQQKKPIKIPKGYSAVEREAIADKIIDKIVSRSKSGVGIRASGKLYDFKPYSKSYKKSLDYKIAGKRGKVNLTLSGSMLNSIEQVGDSRGEIVVGFKAGDPNNAKAEGNQLGTYGTQTKSAAKARRFLDINKSELKKILNQFPLDDENTLQKAIELVAIKRAAEEKAKKIKPTLDDVE